MLARVTENAVAGHIWPTGCYLPTPGLRELLFEDLQQRNEQVFLV